MHIRKLQVSDFRALKDVELSFGADFKPQVFPIGSQNGGGKSTLLQLLFILLHCSAHAGRQAYIRNLLSSFAHPAEQPEKHLASIALDLREDPGTQETAGSVALEFVSLRDVFLTNSLGDTADAVSFADFPAFPRANPQDDADQEDDSILRIRHLLAAQRYLLITWFADAQGGHGGLICRAPGRSPEELQQILHTASEQVFLLGPSTQQYLFLPTPVRQALISPAAELSRPDELSLPRLRYQRELSSAESQLPGFYGYDWLSVKPMLALFRKGRDLDFAQAVETGAYGQNYTSMLDEANQLLHNKRVKPRGDLSGITFTVDRPGEPERTIGLEDLSRGELKRLMIYTWLKASGADDAVVLMDEIEVSFHPDWQIGIVADLEQWGPRNQYLLATHSYELCEALTPAHVRELEPRLNTPTD